ncbi:Proline racemase [Mycena kentingensis (nom. inval.)]|nr:Proline racemase [Mycena kentingensis (nom. inval.)]
MDVFDNLLNSSPRTIKIVDMHTSGEPTRIIVDGYPDLEGTTLLEKRRCARKRWDAIRQRLMREPRGHAEMYGAILVQETELTRAGEADIGVLFCHNEGYSTMCGHATVALGRFLVDTQDRRVFPSRDKLPIEHDAETGTDVTVLRLHAPCGVINVRVPTVDGRSDAGRSVSFLGVPSYASALGLAVRLDDREVMVDIAFGGAFYAIVTDAALGFPSGLRSGTESSLDELNSATRRLKAAVIEQHPDALRHPDADLRFLYGVIVVDTSQQTRSGEELGICFFADQQIDRSPTGSGVMARVALAVDKGLMRLGESRVYHSVVSAMASVGDGPGDGFRGTAVETLEGQGTVVRVEGRAFYTGATSFVVEQEDTMPDGFVVGLVR